MNLQILNFDDAVLRQRQFLNAFDPDVIDFRDWGPKIRLGCSFPQFRRFEEELHTTLSDDPAPVATMLGSGDFHHVTLALLRRLREPFVLLILDNHPDWMGGFPFLHCGTWLNHALKMPGLQRVIHLGGNVDFENAYRFVAPKNQLRDRRILIAPGQNSLHRGFWKGLPNEPLVDHSPTEMTGSRLEALLAEMTPLLSQQNVYVSIDKDVLVADDAVVNWDSGNLRLPHALEILSGLFESCAARLVGLDICGDWSPVVTQGLFRRCLHLVEHPRLAIDPATADRINDETNVALMQTLCRAMDMPKSELPARLAAA